MDHYPPCRHQHPPPPTTSIPVDTIHLTNAGLRLGQRLRRRPNLKPALVQCDHLCWDAHPCQPESPSISTINHEGTQHSMHNKSTLNTILTGKYKYLMSHLAYCNSRLSFILSSTLTVIPVSPGRLFTAGTGALHTSVSGQTANKRHRCNHGSLQLSFFLHAVLQLYSHRNSPVLFSHIKVLADISTKQTLLFFVAFWYYDITLSSYIIIILTLEVMQVKSYLHSMDLHNRLCCYIHAVIICLSLSWNLV